MPANDRGWDGTVSVSRPAEFFAAALRQKLLERGITVGGNHRYERRTDGTLPVGVEIGRIARQEVQFQAPTLGLDELRDQGGPVRRMPV